MLALEARMRRWRGAGRKAFVPFLTAGFPDPDTFRALLRATARCDLVEVGLPFSDPVADGPSICRASDVALARGMHADLLFDVLGQERGRPPAILMTYLNPVLAYGPEAFVRRAWNAGVEGLILTDAPPEDVGRIAAAAAAAGVGSVVLVAPTTPAARMRALAARASGFVYCVALAGTTGARAALGTSARDTVARLRRTSDMPVVVGFGISTPEHVRATCAFADGVVVGSALVDVVDRHAGTPDVVPRFAAALEALRAAAHGA